MTYNGSTVGSASNVGNNGATAAVITVPGGSYALAEAAAAGTTLTRYASTWQCTDQDNTVVSSGSGGSFTLQAPAMTATAVTLVCRITNRTRQADLSITKTDGSGSYTPGGTATYTLLVRNDGPDAVTNAVVTDSLPNGITLRGTWTCSATSGSACAAASGGAVGGTAVNVGVNLINGGRPRSACRSASAVVPARTSVRSSTAGSAGSRPASGWTGPPQPNGPTKAVGRFRG
ncbi:hypothetical protein QT383_17870 [Stenotrophomonas rhizophila]